MFDFAIVGGGIAGLAAAELLQRSGASVLLVERNSHLCGEASAEQHGWFHTGALYAALPDHVFRDALRANLVDLAEYYASFPNMNLAADGVLAHELDSAWFSENRLWFAYARPSDVAWQWRIPWWLALKRLERGRGDTAQDPLLAHIVSTDTAPAGRGRRIGVQAARTVLGSLDRTMNTWQIATDLAAAFLANSGALWLGTTATLSGGSWRAVHGKDRGGPRIPARHIVVTTGKWASVTDPSVRVVASPILVTVPALSERNVVYMSPEISQTLSHVAHTSSGIRYSVVGNATYFDPGRGLHGIQDRVKLRLTARAAAVLGTEFEEGMGSGLYFGYKTEAPTKWRLRNYLSYVTSDEGQTLALPGKFTLSFSLAVRLCRHLGVEPKVNGKPPTDNTARTLIAEPRHAQIARSLAR